MKNNFIYIFFFLLATSICAQTPDSLVVKQDEKALVITDTISVKEEYNPLAPAKAAFYSAVLPGLGQVYNKKYWKIPIIYAGMATGIFFYIKNDKDYTQFRNAYKRRLAGFTDDEFYGNGATPVISNKRLIDAQKSAQKNKDYSVIATLIVYMLNIVDANVDAHLKQFNISEDLSVKPNFDLNPFTAQPNYNVSLTYKLK